MKKKPTPPRTEDPLEQFRQNCRDMLDAALPKHNALSGLQRSWIKQYIENADGECQVESNGNYVTFHWCPVTKAVCKAIDQGDLQKDFNEHALLKWATETGHTLTLSGLNVKGHREQTAATPGKVETKTQDAARATKKRDKKTEGKRGRRPYSVKVHNRDAEIYNALKSGSTYEGLMGRYGMKKSEVRLARDRHRKKVAKKRERLE